MSRWRELSRRERQYLAMGRVRGLNVARDRSLSPPGETAAVLFWKAE